MRRLVAISALLLLGAGETETDPDYADCMADCRESDHPNCAGLCGPSNTPTACSVSNPGSQ